MCVTCTICGLKLGGYLGAIWVFSWSGVHVISSDFDVWKLQSAQVLVWESRFVSKK